MGLFLTDVTLCIQMPVGGTIFGTTMQFLYPSFLWALTALAIPIILHLFYFRRYKKVYFSNLRFLREVKEETSARNRLRNLLILLARLLAMAFIILAFAQPVLPINDTVKAGIRNVSLFIDNSFSMQSFGKDLSLFDRGRRKAEEIVMGYGPEDRFQILGHDLTPSQHQWISQEEALVRIDEMEYTPDVKPLSVIAGRQKQAFAREEGQPVAWMISDFQQSIFDLSNTDTTLRLNLLPLKSVREKNIGLDTAWFASPLQTLNQTSALLYKVHNYAPEDADNIRVTISLDGQERPDATLDLKAGEVRIDTSMITVLNTGWHTLAIRISDFPVTFDDTYFMTFYVEEQLRVLSINERTGNVKIDAVFSNNAYFRQDQTTSNAIAYADLPTYHLIILNELTTVPSGLTAALRKYVQEGGKVLFIPSANGSPDLYNPLLNTMNAAPFTTWAATERQGGTINTSSFIFRDVFSRMRPNMRLPRVTGSFPYAGSGSRGQSLISFRDGGDLITLYPLGKGAFCVMTSPLDEKISDLSLQPEIFVPLLYKLTIYSADQKALSYTIGVDHLIPVDRNAIDVSSEIRITGPSDFIPGLSPLGGKMLLDVQGQIRTAGFYQVMQGDKQVAALAFNYDRTESDLTLADLEDLPDNGSLTVWNQQEEVNFTQLIESHRQGKPLWRWCIILGLIFIATEIALIRLWKST